MSDNETTSDGRITQEDARELLLRGALVVLGLIAVVSLFQLYTSIGALINEWVAREYRPLFRATLNLVVLLGAGIGISLVLRELTAD